MKDTTINIAQYNTIVCLTIYTQDLDALSYMTCLHIDSLENTFNKMKISGTRFRAWTVSDTVGIPLQMSLATSYRAMLYVIMPQTNTLPNSVKI